MSDTISLTDREQTTLTIALQLEHAGYQEAAAYLRGTIAPLRLLGWDEKQLAHIDWAELFRIHAENAAAEARASAMGQST